MPRKIAAQADAAEDRSKLEAGIVADVLPPRPRLAPPVYWIDDVGPDRVRFRHEVQRYLTRDLNLAVMREWVEPDARLAFDALMGELVRRVVLLTEAYVAAGVTPLKKVLKRYEDAKRAGSRGGKVRGAQQVAEAERSRARLRDRAARLPPGRRGEQATAELLNVSRKQLRKAHGKRG